MRAALELKDRVKIQTNPDSIKGSWSHNIVRESENMSVLISEEGYEIRATD